MQSISDSLDQIVQGTADLVAGIAEAIPVPVVLLTPDARVRYANSAFVHMLDVEEEHYLHKRFPGRWLVCAADGLARLRELLHQGSHSGTPSAPVSLFLRSSDESEIATDVYARAVPGLDGGSSNLVLVTFVQVRPPEDRDRSHPKDDKEEEFRTIFEYAPDAYYLCDLTGHFVDVNKAAEDIAGFKRHEAVEKTFLELNLLPESQLRKAQQILIESALGRPTGPNEFTLHRQDGSTVPIEIRTYPVSMRGQVLILGIARDITERKRADAKLLESEAKYRRLHESSRDGCVAVDLDGRILESNPAFQAMLGYTDAQLRQLTYQDLTPPRWHEEGEQIVKGQVYTRGYSDLYEKEYIRADGTVFPIEVHTYLKNDPSGRPAGMWAIVRDITDRKKAEEELRQSDERFRAMTNSAQDAIMMMDPQGCITFYNKTAQAMFGWTADEALGMDLHTLIAPTRYHEAYHGGLSHFRCSGTGPAIGKTLELTALRKDGAEFPIEISLAGVQLGDEWHAVGIVRDITERKAVQEELLREKAFSESVIESLPGMFYMFDDEGRFIWWNKNLERVSECSAQEISTLNPVEAFAPKDQEHVAERIAQAFADGAATVEADFVSKSGHVTPYFMTAARIERDGKPYLLGFGLDITERRQAQQIQERLNAELEASVHELERSNRELRDFAHITAHDLKAPLRGIGTLAEWLDQDCGGQITSESRENLRLLRQRVGRMECLINGILRYSEIGHGDRPLEVLDTHAMVKEVIEQVAPPDYVEIHIEGVLPSVRAERTRLTQVFQNLIANAVKYIDKPQGWIRVGARHAGDCWEFHIADNGPGIEAKHFTRIFKMFQSLRPCDHSDSTGLGLAVVKKIVELYGGKVWVESDLGRGSTFFFTVAKHQETGPRAGDARGHCHKETRSCDHDRR